MAVQELSRTQLAELKQHFLIRLANEGRYGQYFDVSWDSPSYVELANADDLVTDGEVFAAYDGITFVPEDFAQAEEVCA